MTAKVLASLILLAPLNPRPGLPAVGAEIDQTFEIALSRSLDVTTVTIAARGARIVIARELLEQLAESDGPRWSTEQERQAQIAAGRAKKLLEKAGPAATGRNGPLQADSIGDAEYLIAQILEAGKAIVVPEGSVDPVAAISVRYIGTHPGPTAGFGRVVFSLPRPSGEFFSVSWFSS
jgi:hypothetical protein